jgi:uncharacterized repeat protein (TIGR04138 family)
MQQTSFDEVVEQLIVKDKRYRREAYHFVLEALEHTRKMVDRTKKEPPTVEISAPRDAKGQPQREQHVSGQQLLVGVRELALESFGPMAMMVLEEWGIKSCEDVGELVFIMVEHKVMKKTDQDSQADFQKGYDFFDAFRKPYLPQSKPSAATGTPKEAKA